MCLCRLHANNVSSPWPGISEEISSRCWHLISMPLDANWCDAPASLCIRGRIDRVTTGEEDGNKEAVACPAIENLLHIDRTFWHNGHQWAFRMKSCKAPAVLSIKYLTGAVYVRLCDKKRWHLETKTGKSSLLFRAFKVNIPAWPDRTGKLTLQPSVAFSGLTCQVNAQWSPSHRLRYVSFNSGNLIRDFWTKRRKANCDKWKARHSAPGRLSRSLALISSAVNPKVILSCDDH